MRICGSYNLCKQAGEVGEHENSRGDINCKTKTTRRTSIAWGKERAGLLRGWRLH